MNDVLEGKWRLERKLGEGGMGTVYLAHDLQLDRKVAIKVLASQLAGDSELVTRFEREARLTASLEHPNIVPVYAVGEMQGRPFIVMKKLEGRTLAAYLRECGALPGDELLSLMRQLCSGLDFIHARGFIHRDIKSGNIFIGPDGLATILDFGILRTSENADALTRTGMVMGTPQYMSPEQALGVTEIDHRADLYALAVLLFECLTGTLPFEAESELSLIQMQAHAPAPDVVDRAPWVPIAVAEVVKRALSKGPEERYASGGELLAALEDAYGAKIALPVTGPRPAAPVALPDSESPPAATGSMFTRPSMKRLAGEISTPHRVRATPSRTPNRQSPASTENPVGRSTAPVETSSAVPEPKGPTTTGSFQFVRKGRTPAFVAAGTVVALVLGFLAFGRVPSLKPAPPKPGPPAVADSRQAKPPSSVDSLALFDAGLDLREDKNAEAAADAGPTLASAHVEAGNRGPAGSTEEGVEAAPVAETEDARLRAGAKQLARKPLPRGKGSLNLITTLGGEPYWAAVSVDGVRRGNTPLWLDLPAGKHRIHFERAGFKPVNKQIKIASGRSSLLRIELTP
jgi:serine/threonine-protein kinase